LRDARTFDEEGRVLDGRAAVAHYQAGAFEEQRAGRCAWRLRRERQQSCANEKQCARKPCHHHTQEVHNDLEEHEEYEDP
jgi:hypothetical protein